MQRPVDRRTFLNSLGVGAATVAAAGTSTYFAGPRPANAAVKVKGNVPDKPFKTGHITFLTGPANLLGEPGRKGHILAAEEINAEGGLLGKRKIETIFADEAAGTDANVKELRRMKLSERIDLFTGVISSGNTPALGPVAEELGVLTLFNDGCTDFLFDKAVPKPKYVFRVTNIQSADGVTSAVGAARAWPNAKRVASIQPDYSYGRNVHEHFMLAYQKLVPGATAVSEAWPKLGTTDFTPHITKIISDNPDLLICGVWGGDYVAFYKQALRYGLFDKMKVATTLAFGGQPHAIGKDHPEGVLAGCHANYFFTYPAKGRWPINDGFVERYYKRWNEVSELRVGRGLHRPLPAQGCGGEGQPAGRRLARGRGHHRHAGGHGHRLPRGLRLHPARQPPGLQGRRDRHDQERSQVRVPRLGSAVDHHHPHPGDHGPAELAQARDHAQRFDGRGQLAEDHLAHLSGV